MAVRNALLYNVVTPFTGNSSTSSCEHLTIDLGTTLNGNSAGLSLLLTNTLITAVTTSSGYSGASVVNLSSSSGIYEAVGAGIHYLAKNSPHRNSGTLAINAQLANDLKKLTTQAPTLLSPGYLINGSISYTADECSSGGSPSAFRRPANVETTTSHEVGHVSTFQSGGSGTSRSNAAAVQFDNASRRRHGMQCRCGHQ